MTNESDDKNNTFPPESNVSHRPTEPVSNENDNGNVDEASRSPRVGVDSVVRQDIGKASVVLSDWVNDNLLTVRFATIATIGALTVYGISQTPLFFRYRTVADIPSTYFRSRRTIQGRLIHTVTTDHAKTSKSFRENGRPIRCYVRHLSPMERLLPKSIFDIVLRLHPSAMVIRPHDNKRELLTVEMAGITLPDYSTSSPATSDNSSSSSSSSPSSSSAAQLPGSRESPILGDWLARLSSDHTKVSVQLLGRRVPTSPSSDSQSSASSSSSSSFPIHAPTKKRKIPDLDEAINRGNGSDHTALGDSPTEQIAVARLYYRPRWVQLFSTDLAYSMVRHGHAQVSSNGLYGAQTTERLFDTTQSVKDLQADASYLEKLSKAEFQAALESRGMWTSAKVREQRTDIMEEVDFVTKASIWQKLWRRLRGG